MTVEDLFIGTDNESLLNYISFASVEDYKREEYFYNCPNSVLELIVDRFKNIAYKKIEDDIPLDHGNELSWV